MCMISMKYLYLTIISIFGVLALAPPLVAGELQIVGWIEKVRLYPGNFLVHAKLDSGAEYSSLDAANLKEFQRDGRRWVRFDLTEPREGQKITLERPLLREATIKRHYLKSQKRPVIKLGVCLGRIYKETEVNLVDRSGFQYRMLIGRKFMEGLVAIDPAARYTVEPTCPEPDNLE
jgi:hypothetical protein